MGGTTDCRRSGTQLVTAAVDVETVGKGWPRWRRWPPEWTVGRTGGRRTELPACGAAWPPWSTLGNGLVAAVAVGFGSVAVAVGTGAVGRWPCCSRVIGSAGGQGRRRLPAG